MAKTVKKVIIERVIGLIIFLLLVAGLNYFSSTFDNQYYQAVLKFTNTNLILLIMIHIVMSLGELAGTAPLPASLIAPLINACGTMLILTLVFKVFALFDSVIEMNIFGRAEPFYIFVYIIFFVIVLVSNLAVVLRKDKQTDLSFTAVVRGNLHDFFEWLRRILQ